MTQMRVGYAAGAGAEMQLWSQWTAKAEYLYYDLGSARYGLTNLVATAPTFAFVGPSWIAAAQSTARFNGSVARVGLNYRF